MLLVIGLLIALVAAVLIGMFLYRKNRMKRLAKREVQTRLVDSKDNQLYESAYGYA